MHMIKILVVEGSLTMRAIFEQMLSREACFELVGSVTNAMDAMSMIKRTLPDVVALDLNLSGTSGLDLLDQLDSFWHKPKIVIVSAATGHASMAAHEALAHGAVACFDKSALITHSERLIALLKNVGSGPLRKSSFRDDAITLPQSNHYEHS